MDRFTTGNFIARRRMEKNLSQEELAERIGVSNRTISSWERGISFPGLEKVELLCQALGITMNDLLHGDIIPLEERKEISEKNLTILKTSYEKLVKEVIRMETVLCSLSVLAFISSVLYLIIETQTVWWNTVLDVAILALSLLSLILLNVAESKIVHYICPKCNVEFQQRFLRVSFSVKGKKRFLKCPHCKQHHWMDLFIP